MLIVVMSITPPTRQVIAVSQAKQSATAMMKSEILSFVITTDRDEVNMFFLGLRRAIDV